MFEIRPLFEIEVDQATTAHGALAARKTKNFRSKHRGRKEEVESKLVQDRKWDLLKIQKCTTDHKEWELVENQSNIERSNRMSYMY